MQLARYICFTYLWPLEADFDEIWYSILALKVTGIQFWGLTISLIFDRHGSKKAGRYTKRYAWRNIQMALSKVYSLFQTCRYASR